MHRLAVAALFLLFALCANAQNPSSDPFAVSLAQQSVAALTGGATITDVTINANVTSVLGTDYETGTATFKAKGPSESRVDLSLAASGIRSDVRSLANGAPSGAWNKNGAASTQYAGHNCWTDAAWFFPAFGALSQTGNSSFIFSYVGQELRGGVTTQHIHVYQYQQSSDVQRLSAMDFYLDPSSFLPLAVAFQLHSDEDMNINIPVEIDFANYQLVNGVQVPFHFQQQLNGSLTLDSTVTGVVFNTGLLDSAFLLP
jgi:hypothetical protein